VKTVVLSALQGLDKIQVEEYTFAVIDIFRACSTILTLFEKGAASVKIAGDLDEALRYRTQGYTLIGERGGKRIKGFDFDNSPFEVSRLGWQGKNIVLKTTNGSRALIAVGKARKVITACFRNISAAANFLIQCNPPLGIIPIGNMGQPRIEDELCARSLDKLIKGKPVSWRHVRREILKNSQFKIDQKGDIYAKDIAMALEVNTTDIVPVLDRQLVLKQQKAKKHDGCIG